MNIPFDAAAAASLKASVGTIVVVVVAVVVVVPVVLIVSKTGVETDDPSSLVFLVPNADIKVIAAILSSSVVVMDEDVDETKFPVDEVGVGDTDTSNDDPTRRFWDVAAEVVAVAVTVTASTGC